ncbi:MAG: glycosyltransferase family 25 protein [Myxococcales bacterium]|nr:glycosyltransferase family 25 protein [Myxococcales bacterium]
MTISCFVITMEGENARQAYMKSQLDGMRIPFEFWQGNRGSRLDPQALIQNKVVTESFFSGDQQGLSIELAQAGCALSHQKLWQHYSEHLAFTHMPMLILEDDACLDQTFCTRLNSMLLEVPFGTDILYFGYIAESKDGEALGSGLRRARHPRTTTGYLVWPHGTERLLSRVFPLSVPIDEAMARLIWLGQLSACIADPELIVSNPDFKSTIWFPQD